MNISYLLLFQPLKTSHLLCIVWIISILDTIHGSGEGSNFGQDAINTCNSGKWINFTWKNGTILTYTKNYNFILLFNTDKIILINEKTPVWHCINALRSDHPCKHLFCSDCKAKKMAEMGEHRPKRSRLVQEQKDYDDNKNKENSCEHNLMSLEFTGDSKYFEENFIKKKKKEDNCHYATHCVECNGEIRDKIAV